MLFTTLLLSFLSQAVLSLLHDSVPFQRSPSGRKLFRVRPCGEFCKFHMCRNNSTRQSHIPNQAPFTILTPGLGQDPYICRPFEAPFDLVTEIGTPKIFSSGRYIDLWKWNPRGLSRQFRRDFLGVGVLKTNYNSGIIPKQYPIGNQWEYLHNRCMIMPIFKYKIRTENGVEERYTDKKKEDCVAFRTTAPEVLINLQWDSGDDFDLVVVEPDGDVLDSFETDSESGYLVKDNGRRLCLRDLKGVQENILYFPGKAKKGNYIIQVRHVTSCTSKPTFWCVRAFQGGRVKLPTVCGLSVVSKNEYAMVFNKSIEI